MVVLVTGADGQLGQAIQSISVKYAEIDFLFCNSSTLDITDRENILAIWEAYRPQFCINLAAYTAVDLAETEVDMAFDINAVAVQNIAEVCLEYRTVMIHISTDFVFDGLKDTPYTETDLTLPQTVYGKSKLKGEQAVQQILEDYYIVRTSWLYSEFGHNFMKTMLRLSQSHSEINIVNDQWGTPTHACDLASVLVEHFILQNAGKYGLYHYSNEGQCSWYEFALEIFRIHKIAIAVNPIASNQYPTKAIRPRFSVLDKSKIRDNFKVVPQNWRAALAAF